MNRQTLRELIDVHAWVGLSAGLVLFIAFYAGAISVFSHEIDRWDHPEWSRRAVDSSETAQKLLETVVAQHPLSRNSILLQLPGVHGPNAVVYWNAGAQGGWRESRWNDGRLQDDVDRSRLAGFLSRLHCSAGLPQSLGISIVGFASILYGLALFTGLLIYASDSAKDLFAFRVGPNLKRMWQDAHNTVGVLSFPFHVVFAWSGALLCVGSLLLSPFQHLILNGHVPDVSGLNMDVLTWIPAANKIESTLPVSDLVARAHQAVPHLEVESLSYTHFNDENSGVTVYGSVRNGSVVSLAGVGLDGNSGNVLRVIEPRSFTLEMVWYWGLVSLHYGQFGGLLTKFMYFGLGMVGAFLFYSGNLLWIEVRRNRRSLTQGASSRLVARCTVGVSVGCMAGISAAFLSSRILSMGWSSSAQVVEVSYYSIFILSTIWSLIRTPIEAARELLFLAATLTAALPVADVLGATLIPIAASDTWIHVLVDVFALFWCFMLWQMSIATGRRALEGDPNSVWSKAKN